LEAHLLGRIAFDACEELQRRLVAELAQRDDGQVRLLLCEHPDIITVGRRGSASEVRREASLARTGQVPVVWIKRGGGAILHTPGQLLVYPLVPLRWHGLTVGDFLRRFRQAILVTLANLGIYGRAALEEPPDRPCGIAQPGIAQPGIAQPGIAQPGIAQPGFAIDGRTGRLVLFGVAVRDGVTYHGAAINVCPKMGLFHLVGPTGESPRMSCLSAERGQPVRMATVRAELVRQIASAFGCNRYHLYTGHPLLRRMVSDPAPTPTD
jgi:lipoyl(octanoyl) transferase